MREEWKNRAYAAIAIVLATAFYDNAAMAGPVYMNSGHDRTSAWGDVNGNELVPQSISTQLSVYPVYDGKPTPTTPGGSNGSGSSTISGFRWDASVYSYGDFAPGDGNITPEMRQLNLYPLRAQGEYEVDKVTVMEDGEWYYYLFSPAARINVYGTAGGSIWTTSDGKGVDDALAMITGGPQEGFNGFINANVYTEGAIVTDSSVDYQVNDWAGDGPRPEWLEDFRGEIRFWGMIDPLLTNITRVAVVPEPATAGLIGIGGLVALAKVSRRRRSAPLPNPIG